VRNLAIDKTGIFNMGGWDRFARQAMVKYAPAGMICSPSNASKVVSI